MPGQKRSGCRVPLLRVCNEHPVSRSGAGDTMRHHVPDTGLSGLSVALFPALVDVPVEEPVIGRPVRLLVAGLADVLLEGVHLGIKVVHIVNDQGLQRLGALGRAVFEDTRGG